MLHVSPGKELGLQASEFCTAWSISQCAVIESGVGHGLLCIKLPCSPKPYESQPVGASRVEAISTISVFLLRVASTQLF